MSLKGNALVPTGGEMEVESGEVEEGYGLNAPRLLLGIVLGVSAVIRFYDLYQTIGQPIWWDEANYLVKAKSLALGTPSTGYDSGRPILFSLLMAPFFAVGFGETGVRIVLTLASLVSVYLAYRLGERLLSPWVGIMGAAMFSCHNLNLFYTERIMCEIPYVTLALLALVFFLSDNRRLIWAAGPLFSLSVMLRYPAFMIPASVLLFVLLTERTRALRRVDYWICFAFSALVVAPDLLVRGRDTVQATSWMMGPRSMPERFQSLQNTAEVFFGVWDPLSQVALLSGVLIALWRVFTWKSSPSQGRSHLLLLLLLTGPILLQGLWITHLEERYLYGSVVPACLLIASAYWHLLSFCPPNLREAGLGVAATLLLCVCGLMLQASQRLISEKRTTYEELRVAGQWLKSQNVKDTVVLSRSVAQVTYYSDLPGLAIPEQQEEFLKLMASGEAGYAVITGLEAHPEWVKQLNAQTSGLELAMSYPDGQPRMVILRRKG